MVEGFRKADLDLLSSGMATSGAVCVCAACNHTSEASVLQ